MPYINNINFIYDLQSIKMTSKGIHRFWKLSFIIREVKMVRFNQNEIRGRDKICMALDLKDERNILNCVEELSDYVGYFKLNFAFTLFGPELIRKIQAYGGKVFLDLKIHDIPNTAAGYVKAACQLGVDLVTVHTAGGTAMMQETVKTAKEFEQITGKPRPKLIGVTLLTSVDKQTLNSDLNIKGSIEDEVLRRAKNAVAAGLDGIVCSAAELPGMKKYLPDDLFYVTPGIRATHGIPDDHKRVVTCGEAIAAGSSLLVVGRDLLAADDRIEYAKSMIKQIDDMEKMAVKR